MALAIVSYSSSSEEDDSPEEILECSKIDSDSLKRSSESEEPNQKTKTRKTETGRLPLPSSVIDMFNQPGQTEETSEDPSKHGGRIRSFQHERGNWASYVYATVKTDDRLLELAESLITCLRPYGSFIATDDVHLSLSRTFVIRHHWIQPLLQSLNSNLKQCSGCDCAISSINIYTNDEKTRTFVGLKVESSAGRLREYVKQIDDSLAQFNLPVYYKEPSFHTSIAWTVGDVSRQITEEIKDALQTILDDFLEDCPDLSVFSINKLVFRTGNKTYNVALDSSR